MSRLSMAATSPPSCADAQWGGRTPRVARARLRSCVIAALLTGSYWSVLGLSLITIGLYASNAHLFPLPSVFLTGPALATGIAWVNSVGILGGSVSPPVMGYLRDLTGNFTGGLYALAGFAVLAAIVAAVGVRETPAKSRVKKRSSQAGPSTRHTAQPAQESQRLARRWQETYPRSVSELRRRPEHASPLIMKNTYRYETSLHLRINERRVPSKRPQELHVCR